MKILYGTTNKAKLNAMRNATDRLGIELIGLKDLDCELPVVKEDGKFTGLITIKDLSHVVVNENVEDLYTSYNNLLHVLKGEELLRFNDEIIGKLLIASYRSTTFMTNVELKKNMILKTFP